MKHVQNHDPFNPTIAEFRKQFDAEKQELADHEQYVAECYDGYTDSIRQAWEWIISVRVRTKRCPIHTSGNVLEALKKLSDELEHDVQQQSKLIKVANDYQDQFFTSEPGRDHHQGAANKAQDSVSDLHQSRSNCVVAKALIDTNEELLSVRLLAYKHAVMCLTEATQRQNEATDNLNETIQQFEG